MKNSFVELINILGKINPVLFQPTPTDLLQLEEEYQKLIANYSEAYLSGSSWYVGISLIDYIHNEKINLSTFAALCVISNKLINN